MRSSLAAFLLAILLTGCATDQTFVEGKQLLSEGRDEEGLERLEQAVKESPANAEYRAYLFRSRERIVSQLLANGDTARLNGQFDEAEASYRRAQRLDPKNRGTQTGLDALATARRHAVLLGEARQALQNGDDDRAETTLRQVLAEDPKQHEARAMMRTIDGKRASETPVGPQLKAALAKPITLEFRDASLRAAFEVMSRTAGIYFVFDKDVRPDLKTSIFVSNTSVEDAMQLLLASNQLDRKLQRDNTILVYPNTPAKQRDYQDLTVKTFYLANADVKQTANLVRSMLKVRDVFTDEKLNMMVIRDTPEAVRMAAKLVAAQDLAEPEAVLEVEVLEVDDSRLQTLGVQWPTQIGYGQLVGGASTQTNVVTNPTTGATSSIVTPGIGATVANGVIDLRRKALGLTTFIANPALVLNLRANDSFAKVLANPRIRVKNHEKARIHIGDRVPVFTSTAVINAGIAQSVTYLDVGVKLEVEPAIGLDDDVTIRVGLEVSSIVDTVNFQNSVAFRVGTRTASTTLRLRDGETQMLAGLIQDEERRAAAKVPGLGDLPLLGRLFSNNNDSNSRTEVVLLITPHVVSNLALPGAGVSEFAAGTESGVGRIGSHSGEGATQPAPAGAGSGAAAASPPPAAQQLMLPPSVSPSPSLLPPSAEGSPK